MEASKTKQRLVGLLVLFLLAVIILPALVDYRREPERQYDIVAVPPQPEYEDYYPRVVPIDTSRLDALGSEQGSVTRTGPDNGQAPAGSSVSKLPVNQQEQVPRDQQLAAPAQQKNPTPRVIKAVEESPTAKIPVARQGWVVQVGTFAEVARAEKVRAALVSNQFKAFIEPVENDKGSMYRVRVGPEMSRSAAEKSLEQIRGRSEFSGVVLKFP